MEREGTISEASKNKGRLKIVLGFTLLYLIVEVIGGIMTKSLALLADAGHMLTDVGGLALALIAINYAERNATAERTYGYYRAEILAALANAVVLIGISFYILYEAYLRFLNPPEVQSKEMIIVAAIGLLVNIAGMVILRKSSGESLNMKGAYFEVLSDMLTSIGVIAAGIIMLTTGWYYADPLLSAGIGLFILPRTWILLKESIGILLEGTPKEVNMAGLRSSILEIEGVEGIHDLHVWVLTSGVNAMTAHIVLKEGVTGRLVLPVLQKHITENFKISHTTLQLEEPGFGEEQTHV
ncbi:cobalt-zinc-cadmium efflux system protein [Pedobacter cryoconitis]|uniref:Cobalt-zinc-cadmium efflux system protein n=1 Tax=Pedobacter cryoconitis TaxID=188932 RepID=A0A7W8ZPQ3_9SPHI|nr:cation diffusion facilitator family transporter [Pedobacter cryoconitis]MBB5637667.1 cobalt-zinc-cadmium efflux system protein [Pedobacter cryoconitis]MBB6270095.1 cobalt-zinc-cadmium efflux system protein [Pedobacter cryoconitis]